MSLGPERIHRLIHQIVMQEILRLDDAQTSLFEKRLPHRPKARGLRRGCGGVQRSEATPDRNPRKRVAGNLGEATQRWRVDRGYDSEPDREVGVVQHARRVAIRGNWRRWRRRR